MTPATDTDRTDPQGDGLQYVEDGCRSVYGRSWDGPTEKMPGPEMKKAWRDLVFKAQRPFLDALAQLRSDLRAVEAERDEARVHLSVAQGPDPEQAFDEIGMAGRKTILGKHKAANYAHIRKVLADLDAAGMTEAADTLLWAHWWRQNERAWTNWMRTSCLEMQHAAEAERDLLRTRVGKALDDACRMSAILLMAGEMTAQERRTAGAVANGLAAKVRAAMAAPQPHIKSEGAGDA